MPSISTARTRSKGIVCLILTIMLIAGGLAGFFLFFETEQPTIAVTSPETYLGSSSSISFSASDQKSGLRKLVLSITQEDTFKELYTESFPRNRYYGMIGTPEQKGKIDFNPTDAGFHDGSAQLRLEAFDYSCNNMFRGNHSVVTREMRIDTKAPKIAILHSERYINPGGSGIVIYRLDDGDAVSGLLVNDHFHPGFLIDETAKNTYIAYFGIPYDAAELKQTLVTATDSAGNNKTLAFSTIFKNTSFRQDRINIDDVFLEQKIPEFEQHYPEMQGSFIEKYIYSNNTIRLLNNKKISDLCKSPNPLRLWAGQFQRMPGSPRADYGDHRTYYYNSEAIDTQVHLGIDIASIRHDDVRAVEKGIVIFADYNGIYGNTVMLDHGQGVFSLYSHLSQINVLEKDMVAKGAILGATGTTGMAGGDHLHFSMLINGIFVTPKEWWDQHWIDVTIEDPLTESRFR